MDRSPISGSVTLSVLSSLSIVALVIGAGAGLLLIVRASTLPPDPVAAAPIPPYGPGVLVLEPSDEVGDGSFTAPVAVDLGLDAALVAGVPSDLAEFLSPHGRGSTADLLAAGAFGFEVIRARDSGDPLEIREIRRIAGDVLGLDASLSDLDDVDHDGIDDDLSFTIEASDGSAACVTLGPRRTLAIAQGLQVDLADGAAVNGYSWDSSGPCTTEGGQPSGGPVTGATPGRYGGSAAGDVCDAGTLVASLLVSPGLAERWSAVHEIAVEQLDGFVAGLTPVVLLADTVVTDFRIVGGVASARQAVLERGTAVLVDRRGVPAVRCLSGSPLTPPQPLPAVPSFVGTAWPGFRPSLVEEIVAAPGDIVEFTLVDLSSGFPLVRPAGSAGTAGSLAGPLVGPDTIAAGEG